ncbi:hypothetical protein ACRQ5Q_39365 [Bradyrhizobium sp. PMVTL-01]|uniref:hypothetical protein n=1 Tax=Bradyrhizobium sp. PMVTL-01 TaxID=3434999 RepID=UPI003F6F07EC
MTKHTDKKPHTTSKIILDRLTVCFNGPGEIDPSYICGQLLNDKKQQQIPGLKITSNARYKVRASIPLPFINSTENAHPIFLEAGPHHKSLPACRLDFNPAKLSPEGIDDLIVLLDTSMDATATEFFSNGQITRVDVAVDLAGHTLDEVIVLAGSKRKHGVYSDRQGCPETTYLGTPRSKRIVAYTKHGADGPALRLEVRCKPHCSGSALVSMKNPFKNVLLLPADVLDELKLGFPGRILADSIRVRGLKHALAPFPPDQRKSITALLKVKQSLLPDADELWTGWKTALIQSGLGKELGLLNPPTHAYGPIPPPNTSDLQLIA